MKITIGSDHRGYALKEKIKQKFSSIEWDDVGTDNEKNRVDYPIFAQQVVKKILTQEVTRGIVICGSGIGVSIAANRYQSIYAALCWSSEVARVAREHDHANVLALPADFLDDDSAYAIVDTWLKTPCKDGRYQERLKMIDQKGK